MTNSNNCPIYAALMSVKADVAEMEKASIMTRYATYSHDTAMQDHPGHWGSNKAFNAAHQPHDFYGSRRLAAMRAAYSEVGMLCSPGYVEEWKTAVSDPSFRYADRVYCYGKMEEAKLDAHCDRVAEATCLLWYGKMTAKLGTVDACTIVAHPRNGGEYAMHVTVRGTTVTIRQIVTHNYRSDTGKSYFQFPARIYIGGKFVTEAAYKQWLNAA